MGAKLQMVVIESVDRQPLGLGTTKQRFRLITMRDKTVKRNDTFRSAGYRAPPLKLAVQLAVSQLDQGIGLAEAVQFAAKYHNV